MIEGVFEARVKQGEDKQRHSWLMKFVLQGDGDQADTDVVVESLGNLAEGRDIVPSLEALKSYFQHNDCGTLVSSNVVTKLIQFMRGFGDNLQVAGLAVDVVGALWKLAPSSADVLFDNELIETVLNCGILSKIKELEVAAFSALLMLCSSHLSAVEFLCCDSCMDAIDKNVFACDPKDVNTECVQGCLHLLNSLLDVSGNDEIYGRFVERVTHLVIDCPDRDVASIAPLTLAKLMHRFELFKRAQEIPGWDRAMDMCAQRLIHSDNFEQSMNLYVLLPEIKVIGTQPEIFKRVIQDIEATADTAAPSLYGYVRMCFVIVPRQSYDSGTVAAILANADNMCFENKQLACLAVLEMLSSELCSDADVQAILATGAGEMICDVAMTMDVDVAISFMEFFAHGRFIVRSVFLPFVEQVAASGLVDYFTELGEDNGSSDFKERVRAFQDQLRFAIRLMTPSP